VLGSRLYISGGVACGGPFSSEVWSAEVAIGGELRPLRREADLPYRLTSHGMVAVRGSLYVIGGDEGDTLRADVWAATPDGQGAIAQWRAVSSLPAARSLFAVDAR
jgi:hypothetical protein